MAANAPDSMSMMAASTTDPRREGMISRMDNLLNQLFANIEVLETTLSVIRTVGPDSGETQPEEAPANRLHEFIIRLDQANRHLKALNSELDL